MGSAERVPLMPFNIFYQRLSEHFINTSSRCTVGKVPDNALAVSPPATALGHPRDFRLVSPWWRLGTLWAPLPARTGGGPRKEPRQLVEGVVVVVERVCRKGGLRSSSDSHGRLRPISDFRVSTEKS